MRKQIFTLVLLGLMCSVGRVWGTNVDLFSAVATTAWSVPAGTTNASVASYATISGGQMYVSNGESKAKDLIKSQSNTMGFCNTNASTRFKIVLPFTLQVGDVISASIYRGGDKYGIWMSTGDSRPGNAPTAKIITKGSSNAWENNLTYTVATDDGICGSTFFFTDRATSNSTYYTNIKVTRNLSAPWITTQPVGAAYAIGDPISALAVAATASSGDLSYQWYTCDDANRTNSAAIDGATSASYTPSAAGFYYAVVTDSNGSTTSNVVQITIEAVSAPGKPSITGAPVSAVEKGAVVTLEASASGVPAPTYEWYQCDDAEKANPVKKASTASYSPSTAAKGTFYFYAVATNSEGSKISDVITLEVSGSHACELINVQFSNGAYGAIPTLSAGAATVTVPYLAGEVAPSVDESSIVISAGATYELEGNTLTVTAEDGTTTGTYTITKTAFTPLAVSGNISTTTFTEVPAWISNPYGFQWNPEKTSEQKGVKFAKDENNDGTRRISLGNTRQYYFIEAAQTLTLTSALTSRGINVYRNGVKLDAPTATGDKDATISIALDPSAPCMIMIESKNNNGDGGFYKYAVTAATNATAAITGAGWATFCSTHALNFAGDISGLEAAYIVTGGADGVLSKTKVTGAVAAGTGLLLKGSEGTVSIPVVASGTDYTSTNKLMGVTVKTQIDANTGWVLMNDATNGLGFYKNANAFTLGAKTAYLPVGFTGSNPDAAPSLFRIVDEEHNATDIQSIEGNVEVVKFIENGQLLIKRDNVVYDTMGRIVR